MLDYKLFDLGELRLQRGMTVPGATLAYKTYGTLADDRSNAVLYPTSFGAHHTDIEWLIGPGHILDTDRWFVVIPNMFGNGRWPEFTHWDNIHAQKRLLEEKFGVEKLAMVYGWSMGAQQALHWGAVFPDRVARICAVCGSARTSPHNKVFLDGVRSTLKADPNWRDGYFAERPVRGLRAMGRVYAGWAMSQAFYREHLYLQHGFASLEDFLVRAWEANYLRRDADNLLAMLDVWTRSDISDNEIHNGDIDAALGAITAKTLIMPGRTDLYFTPEDSEAEAARIPGAEYRPIESIWGHRAGNPIESDEDRAFLRDAVHGLLAG
ncbi:MAG: alpha/beta fold hydrolase [Alphaproteobacteria bacterium]|nr:alpha/beta fold hydrolase [Alphaproteobacteria bacterium]